MPRREDYATDAKYQVARTRVRRWMIKKGMWVTQKEKTQIAGMPNREDFASPEDYQRAYHRAWYAKHPEIRGRKNEIGRASYKRNSKKRMQETCEWRKNNPERYAEYVSKNHKEHYDNDPHYKLRVTLRNRLNNALKGNYKTGSAVRDLGCTVDELKVYLEKQFKPGMGWHNHGKKETDWQIDHVRPLGEFLLTDPKQYKAACHYTNLRPLWRSENLGRPKPHRAITPKAK